MKNNLYQNFLREKFEASKLMYNRIKNKLQNYLKRRNAILNQKNFFQRKKNTRSFIQAICEVEENLKSTLGVDKSSAEFFFPVGSEKAPISTSQVK